MLSHGEKRRLEIAAVLALEPKILLLDEPLAGLGADESRDVVALIEGLKRDCAIMLIEHDIDVVFALADRITVLDNGRVIACGTPPRFAPAKPCSRPIWASISVTALLQTERFEAAYGPAAGGARRLARGRRPAMWLRCSVATAWARPR